MATLSISLWIGFFAATIIIASGSARANLIVNGSFETPVVPSTSFVAFTTLSQGIPGWTIFDTTATNDNVLIVDGAYTGGTPATFLAQDGNQWLDLTGQNLGIPTGVSQTVSTVAGGNYTLSYYVGNSGDFGIDSTVAVFIDGVQETISVNETIAPLEMDWQLFSLDFTATTTTTLIAFVGLDPEDDGVNGLDNVTVTATAVEVSSPGSTLILALGSLGLLSHRRRQGRPSNFTLYQHLRWRRRNKHSRQPTDRYRCPV